MNNKNVLPHNCEGWASEIVAEGGFGPSESSRVSHSSLTPNLIWLVPCVGVSVTRFLFSIRYQPYWNRNPPDASITTCSYICKNSNPNKVSLCGTEMLTGILRSLNSRYSICKTPRTALGIEDALCTSLFFIEYVLLHTVWICYIPEVSWVKSRSLECGAM